MVDFATPEGDPDVAVIGAGPAGLMAAEAAAGHGARVAMFDHMPSPARKLLMAGKSGLNVTKDEPVATALTRYGIASDHLAPMLRAFGPAEVVDWMAGLGQDAFTGSSGRVFPAAMKASPLLRAWLARLDGMGVTLHRRHRWTGWDGDAATFDTPDGPVRVCVRATVLAMGGASWRRLGSDGTWAADSGLAERTTPFAPSNVGLRVAWSPRMARHFGAPVKNVVLSAGPLRQRGEVTIGRDGLEGGGLYPLTPALRSGHSLLLDLKPDLDASTVAARMAGGGKDSLSNRLRKCLKLSPAAIALLREWAPDGDPARWVKALPVRHDGLRDLDEAISTAGGLRFDALDVGLMLRDRPGTFACGEMLDWEAPTGGYLLTACLATGRWAGAAAGRWATSRDG